MAHNYTQPSRLTRAGYRYLYDPMRRAYLRSFVDWLALDGTERVLDLGSGAGSEAIHLARALDRGRVTCLDVSATWLAEARRRLRGFRNVDFVCGEAAGAGLEPAAYHLVVAHYMLHDVDASTRGACVAAVARALRPDGRFVVVEPMGSYHGLAADELDRLMAGAGLVEQSREVVHPPFGSAVRVVFRRA